MSKPACGAYSACCRTRAVPSDRWTDWVVRDNHLSDSADRRLQRTQVGVAWSLVPVEQGAMHLANALGITPEPGADRRHQLADRRRGERRIGGWRTLGLP